MIYKDSNDLPYLCSCFSVLNQIECNHYCVMNFQLFLESRNLLTLSLEGNQIQTIPEQFDNLKQLERFALDCNLISSVPSQMERLANLTVLSLKGLDIFCFLIWYDLESVWRAEGRWRIGAGGSFVGVLVLCCWMFEYKYCEKLHISFKSV